MSYILDALKKAESERRRGAVPNVHAQPASMLPLDLQVDLYKRPWIWIALAMLLAALLALAWVKPWESRTEVAATLSTPLGPTAVPAVAVASPPLPIVPAPAPMASLGVSPPVTQAVPESVVPAVPTPPAVRPAPPPKTASASVHAVPPVAAKPAASATPAGKQVATPIAPTPAAIPTAEKKSPEIAPSEPQIGLLADLPDNIRRDVPALSINGYIYSAKPSDRSVLINNRLLREGDQVVPGLIVEKMLPREAVLNYMGYRYRLPY